MTNDYQEDDLQKIVHEAINDIKAKSYESAQDKFYEIDELTNNRTRKAFGEAEELAEKQGLEEGGIDRYNDPRTIYWDSLRYSAHFGIGLAEGLAERKPNQNSLKTFVDLARVVQEFMAYGSGLAMSEGQTMEEDHQGLGKAYANLGWEKSAMEIIQGHSGQYIEMIKELTPIMTKGDYWWGAAHYIGMARHSKDKGWPEIIEMMNTL